MRPPVVAVDDPTPILVPTLSKKNKSGINSSFVNFYLGSYLPYRSKEPLHGISATKSALLLSTTKIHLIIEYLNHI